ncbi:MAG: ATP-binding cassette domain-containing protein [Candidatus Marinimicrobia bacterium]|nr:ATP-binding cassette domain-containing protein [Candidatus Neomarinimicrobiota bacterium]
MIEIHFPLEKKFQGGDKIIYSADQKALKLNSNYFYYFQGKNGVGKTTLLNIISLLTDFEGGVKIEDNTLCLNKDKNDKSNHEKSNIRKNHFSYVFQDPHIINIYTIRENLKIVNPLFDFDKDMSLIFKKIDNLKITASEKLYLQTKLTKLIHEKNNSPFYLSGGEKQLLSFIRAMIKPSNIIFADEPWAAMDKHLKEFIEQELYQYLDNKDIFSGIRNRNDINHLHKKNTVVAIAHIFHHSTEISAIGNHDKNYNYKIHIKKINSGKSDDNSLELIRFSN